MKSPMWVQKEMKKYFFYELNEFLRDNESLYNQKVWNEAALWTIYLYFGFFFVKGDLKAFIVL